jgi:hypothetical protein
MCLNALEVGDLRSREAGSDEGLLRFVSLTLLFTDDT